MPNVSRSGKLDTHVSAGEPIGRHSSTRTAIVAELRRLADDETLIRDVARAFVADGRRFDQLLVALVANPTFAQRRLETP